jgi:hypothetical protein
MFENVSGKELANTIETACFSSTSAHSSQSIDSHPGRPQYKGNSELNLQKIELWKDYYHSVQSWLSVIMLSKMPKIVIYESIFLLVILYTYEILLSI